MMAVGQSAITVERVDIPMTDAEKYPIIVVVAEYWKEGKHMFFNPPQHFDIKNIERNSRGWTVFP